MMENSVIQLSNQVLNYNQMLYLRKLGVDISDATFYIEKDILDNCKVVLNTEISRQAIKNGIPTYTVLDLLNKLPIKINGRFNRYISMDGNYIEVGYVYGDYCPVQYVGDSLLELLYKLLYWVEENK